MKYTSSKPTKWRKYQSKLQRTTRTRQFLKNLPLLIIVSLSAVVVSAAVVWASLWVSEHWRRTVKKPKALLEKKLDAPPPKILRQDLPDLLDEFTRDSTLLNDVLVCLKDGKQYTVRTTIDPKLQKYIQVLPGEFAEFK